MENISSNANTRKKRKNTNKARERGRTDLLNLGDKQRASIVVIKDIVPARVLTKLKFICNRVLGNAANPTASIQLNANGAYDPDPAVASNGMPGFTEWAGFYGRYKVLRVKSCCIFVNRETFPVLINLGFEPVFYTANTKSLAYFEGPNQKTQIIPASQTARGVQLSMTRSGAEVVGDEIVFGSLNYTGTSAANPLGLWYTSVACSSSFLGALLANGVAIRWEVTMEVEFFERKLLSA